MAHLILVVAQHISLRQSLCDWLVMDLPGCHVLQAACPAEAIGWVRRCPICGILVDVYEPWSEGLKAVQRIHHAAPDIPLIAIGFEETELHRNEANAAGATIYVCKAALQTELIPALQHILWNELE